MPIFGCVILVAVIAVGIFAATYQKRERMSPEELEKQLAADRRQTDLGVFWYILNHLNAETLSQDVKWLEEILANYPEFVNEPNISMGFYSHSTHPIEKVLKYPELFERLIVLDANPDFTCPYDGMSLMVEIKKHPELVEILRKHGHKVV